MYEHRRKRALGRFGELVALENLTNNGYECIHLGDHFRCFDIEASKNEQKYLVSVKTRNHTTAKNDEKRDPYNLLYNKTKGSGVDAEVKIADEIARQRNAIPMWVAIRVDAVRKVYDIYWGFISDLINKKQIPMCPSDRRRHKKFGENVFDPRIHAKLSNVRKLGIG